MKYGISEIGSFFAGDMRFLSQFVSRVSALRASKSASQRIINSASQRGSGMSRTRHSMKYGISEIGSLFAGDMRFLSQFV
jgi:phenylalanyl-tRNA synthetase alpha subunit